MAVVRGIFALSDSLYLKGKGYWTNLDDVFIAGSELSNSGYFGGGITPSFQRLVTVDKLTYSTDTTVYTPSANLSLARYNLAATGNSEAGYFGGGNTTTLVSTTDRLTYSTDTTVYTPSANLSRARQLLAATGSSTAGYFGGGRISALPSFYSIMDKLTYSTDLTAVLPSSANLSASRSYLAATGNSEAGYFGGGFVVSRMDKITYSTDTTAFTPSANLSASRHSLGATGNSTAGYFGGGAYSPGPGTVLRSTMDKLTYSTDTTVYTPGANLSIARQALAATGNSEAGYFGGGNPGNPGAISAMDKLTYSTDTTQAAPSGANLSAISATRYGLAASSSTANGLSTILSPPIRFSDNIEVQNTGYFGGGSPGLTKMDKLTYSNDTTIAIPSANLGTGRSGLAASGNFVDGYFVGGSPLTSIVEKLRYFTDTRTGVPTTTLSSSRYGLSATGTITAGYFGGGFPAAVTTMDKITYSTETRSVIPGAGLSLARYWVSATGSSTAGYFGGGLPGPRSTVDKLIYATETTSVIPNSSLSAAKYGTGASGNEYHGYFVGGSSSLSTVDKISYGSDTTSSQFNINLSIGRRYLTGTGNNRNGYFAGGFPAYSTVDKINYESGTLNSIPSASLSLSRHSIGSSSSRENNLLRLVANHYTSEYTTETAAPDVGYIAGGIVASFPSASVSTVDKCNYTTNTTANLPSAPFPSTIENAVGTGGDKGNNYFTGGTTSRSPYNRSQTVQRLSTYTDTFLNFGLIPQSVDTTHAASGNTTTGYHAGGWRGSASSTISKFTYNTNTGSTLFANISIPRFYFAGTGSPTAGYYGGGVDNSTPQIRYSTMDRLIYSSETLTTLPGASLSYARNSHSACGNSNVGYFGYGVSPANIVASTFDKISYSTDTRISTFNVASPGGFGLYGTSAAGNQSSGYFAGGSIGDPSPAVSVIRTINYTTDSSFNIPGLSSGRQWTGSSGTKQYLPSSEDSIIRRCVDYTILKPEGREINILQSPNYGYFGGGNPGPLSSIEKLDFSTDTPSTITSTFSSDRWSANSVGSQISGYFTSGRVGGTYTTRTEKVTYVTDTIVPVPSFNSNSLTIEEYAGTGNSSQGYLFEGTRIQKLTYSSDSSNTLPTNNISGTSRIFYSDATGSNTIGYIHQAYDGNYTATYSSIDKFIYSTDTYIFWTNITSSQNKGKVKAMSSPFNAYFVGGVTGSLPGPTPSVTYLTSTDKISYSTDTRTLLPGASLITGREESGATGSSTQGYVCGGFNRFTPAYFNSTEKITYSSDTNAVIPSAALSIPKGDITGVSPRENNLPISYNSTNIV